MARDEIFLKPPNVLLRLAVLFMRHRAIPAAVAANTIQKFGHELDALRPKKGVLSIMDRFVLGRGSQGAGLCDRIINQLIPLLLELDQELLKMQFAVAENVPCKNRQSTDESLAEADGPPDVAVLALELNVIKFLEYLSPA
ncbi:hypothetical protein Tdes44962_MAKER08495 [Teratosphaeria destructans]|uniref:Uncharacterized protein n=1 Tax=Teratosphaeria destructans TaxID=418781 RepID=A0A9W7SWI3_9PEZI|nr:hypothetical protein Tdes44962_MAKER08495 [Teratosphaeria destructans]